MTNNNASVPAVRITDLHKKFGSLEVLKGISLEATNGGVVAIIGGSGSGKSTMLRCINMLETPTSGRIEIHGEELLLKSDGKGGMVAKDAKQLRRIRSRLAMVFQSFNLWQHLTVLGNIIEVPVQVLGMSKDEAIAKAEKLLARVGLSDKRDVYPAFLSGGQQQRAAIARALAVDPKVMNWWARFWLSSLTWRAKAARCCSLPMKCGLQGMLQATWFFWQMEKSKRKVRLTHFMVRPNLRN
jgi:octopine/nopaline transport system ATP-binding protein